MWPVSEFEVEIRVGVEAPRCRYVTRSAIDIVAELKAIVGPLSLDVDAILRRGDGQQDISLGELILWFNGSGMAWVRLLEHREYNPSDPARAGLTGEVGGFLDESNSPFVVPAADAITVEQALLVLGYWLDCGGRFPELAWS